MARSKTDRSLRSRNRWPAFAPEMLRVGPLLAVLLAAAVFASDQTYAIPWWTAAGP